MTFFDLNLLAAGGIKSDTQRSFPLITFFILNILTSLYHVKSSNSYCIEPCKSDYKIFIPA